MKTIYSSLIVFFQTVVSLLLVSFYNHKGAAYKVRSLKKERNGRSATILANGPSARDILANRIDLLGNTDILVLNYFGNTDMFFELKPSYYIMLDPVLFNFDFRNPGLNEAPNDEGRIVGIQLMENFKKVNWKMTLFVPAIFNNKIFRSCFDDNSNIRVVPFYSTRILGYNWFCNYMYKRAQGVPSSRNVIIPALLLMILAGYKTIYLYGCEFSWTKTMDVDPDNGRMFFNDSHFYKKEEIRYFGKGAYLWWLKAISEMLEGVEKIALFANTRGVHIINRTKGSFIDAFDYENPDTI